MTRRTWHGPYKIVNADNGDAGFRAATARSILLEVSGFILQKMKEPPKPIWAKR